MKIKKSDVVMCEKHKLVVFPLSVVEDIDGCYRILQRHRVSASGRSLFAVIEAEEVVAAYVEHVPASLVQPEEAFYYAFAPAWEWSE